MLFLLKTINIGLGYDVTYGIVVRAEREEQARKIASEEASFTYEDSWLDNTQTTCEVIDADGPTEILCIDHRSA